MENKPTPETPLLDTSRMSAGQRAALEMAEAAREPTRARTTFAGGLFMGRPDFSLLTPFPVQSLEDRDQGDAFIERLSGFLTAHADPDEIDRTGEIPDSVTEGLAALGAFGIKIPRTYGGLGLSQTNYARAAMWLGGFCANITALLSAHQSIGVPQPLLVFGTEAQRHAFLPRCARGEISAFALTEQDVGSDPARMKTTAVMDADGEHYLINGEKLWCTNGTKAGLIVVMAKTPNAKSPNATTAFIVEAHDPGVEVVTRCHFMGLRALYNGVIRFTNVRVSKDRILGGEGKGLKVALTTLNTGRITLPAACAGMSKQCLTWSRDWANQRVQWGAPIAQHAAIADKLARMAAHTFAMESMVLYVSALVDRDKHADIRLEAAMAKLWGTERGWEIVNETLQIRGGRGYETAASLTHRGETPVPVERFLRDARINTIFEGSSEIMRLFIAREALDPHLRVGAAVLHSQLPWKKRLRAALGAGWFYARWYPKQWLPRPASGLDLRDFAVRREMRTVTGFSRKLARRLFHAMIRFGPALEKRQMLLGRFVDIATSIFALSAACARADTILTGSTPEKEKADLRLLLRYLGKSTRSGVRRLFAELRDHADNEGRALAKALT